MYLASSFSVLTGIAFSIYIREYMEYAPDSLKENITVILIVLLSVTIISYVMQQWERDIKKLCDIRRD